MTHHTTNIYCTHTITTVKQSNKCTTSGQDWYRCNNFKMHTSLALKKQSEKMTKIIASQDRSQTLHIDPAPLVQTPRERSQPATCMPRGLQLSGWKGLVMVSVQSPLTVQTNRATVVALCKISQGCLFTSHIAQNKGRTHFTAGASQKAIYPNPQHMFAFHTRP